MILCNFIITSLSTNNCGTPGTKHINNKNILIITIFQQINYIHVLFSCMLSHSSSVNCVSYCSRWFCVISIENSPDFFGTKKSNLSLL